MRHRKHNNTLGLVSAHRKALLMNLAKALIEHGKITTTHKKAKAASQYIDKLVTLAKRKDVHAQRQLMAKLRSRDVVKKLVDDIAPRFEDRNGGYTRVLKYKNRAGDNALQSILEFTELPVVEDTPAEKTDAKSEKKGILKKVKDKIKKGEEK